MHYDELKYRKRLSTTIDAGLWEQLHELNWNSRIPVSRLLDEAVELLLKNHHIEACPTGVPYDKTPPKNWSNARGYRITDKK